MFFELVEKFLGKIGGSQNGVRNASLLGRYTMMNDS